MILISVPIICGLEWNLENEHQIDLTWWFSWFDLSSNKWEKDNTTLSLRCGQGQDYSTFYEAFNHGGFYLILNLAQGGGLTGVSDPSILMHKRKPHHMVIESVKTYSFDKPHRSSKNTLQAGNLKKPSKTICLYDKLIQFVPYTDGKSCQSNKVIPNFPKVFYFCMH